MSFQHDFSASHKTADSDQVEKDLAHLINVTGKMRMLSHQVVMCVLLHDQTGQSMDFKGKLSEALSAFQTIARQVTEPGPSTGLSKDTAMLLHANRVVTEEQANCLTTFMRRAAALQVSLNKDEAAGLGEFVASTLLGRLNALIENIRATLDMQISRRRKEQEPLLRATSTSLDEINRLAKTLQIVAMNASLEAQRAGENGAAFGEIAREMRGLSIKSLDQAGRLERDLTQFKSAQTTASGRPA